MNPISQMLDDLLFAKEEFDFSKGRNTLTYPCYFLRERSEEDGVVYEFCITGINKEDLKISIQCEYLNIEKKEGFVICRALINKYDKLNLKSIKASLKNGILFVYFDYKHTKKIIVNVE